MARGQARGGDRKVKKMIEETGFGMTGDEPGEVRISRFLACRLGVEADKPLSISSTQHLSLIKTTDKGLSRLPDGLDDGDVLLWLCSNRVTRNMSSKLPTRSRQGNRSATISSISCNVTEPCPDLLPGCSVALVLDETWLTILSDSTNPNTSPPKLLPSISAVGEVRSCQKLRLDPLLAWHRRTEDATEYSACGECVE